MLGAIPGILSIRANAEFSEELAHTFSITVPILIILSHLILLGISWYLTRSARSRLNQFVKGSLTPNPAEEFMAWREITSLAWRYGIAAVIVIFTIDILPPVLMALLQSEAVSSPFQPTLLSSPNPAYVIFGGLVSIIGAVILAILIIERSTLPARLMLIPADFETQLKGRRGALLTGKFQILILALIATGLLLIAPIGYHQTIRILYAESALSKFLAICNSNLLYSV